MKISHGRKSQLIVSCQVMTNGSVVIFCGFILHLIGHEAINIPEIFSGVHGFTGNTVIMNRGRINEKLKMRFGFVGIIVERIFYKVYLISFLSEELKISLLPCW